MRYSCVIFDLDGTIYFGRKLANKANDVIHLVRKLYKNVFFVTNNSAKKREEIWHKLLNMGIDAELGEVINSGYAIAKYLNENKYQEVYCIGTQSLKSEIESFKIKTDSKTPEAIVVGYNKDFSLNDLNEVLNLDLKNYKLIIANQERTYPGENGVIMPGAGPIVKAVEYALNKKTDIIIGKPNPIMVKLITSNLHIKPEDICVVGDSYESDIKMAQSYGADSILISEKSNAECKTIKQLSNLLEVFK